MAKQENPKFVCMDGDIVPFAEGTLHIMTPALRYAAHVFEGIRGYWNEDEKEIHVFRLKEHLDRLRFSMKVMRFGDTYTNDYLADCILRLIQANELRQDTYIRVSVFIGGDGEMNAPGPVVFAITAHPKGRMIKDSGGLNCCVSSWSRISDNASPPRVKCAANYYNGRLAYMQANADGYDSTIILNASGKVAEAPGACIFIIRDGVPATPSISQGILESITRDTVAQLFSEYFEAPAQEREIDRTELYAAEEMFLCGTGYQILPIVTVDRLNVGNGEIGPLTTALNEKYTAIARGQLPDHPEWRTPVYG
jgi:branched-chain amino acid aminotransferase